MSVPARTPSPSERARVGMAITLLAIVGAAAACHLWGIRRNLPVIPEMDEVLLYDPAIRIASTGRLNPGWFGYPGSTVIYPTALAAHVWQAIARDGAWLQIGAGWSAILQQSQWELVLLGRLVSVAYSLAALPLVFLIGRRVFGIPAALAGVLLAALCPTTVDFAQQLRTDGPAMFFGVLHLWLCLRLVDRPSWTAQLLAGGSLGLAIATRVLTAGIAPVLLAVDAWLVWSGGRAMWRPRLRWALAGILSVPIAFGLVTPYAVLDHETALATFREIAGKQETHLGADGLGPADNFWWYLSTALPEALTWPQTALAAFGVASIIRSRDLRALLLLLYAVSFIGGISMAGLHWSRWLLPALPVAGLFAGHGLVQALEIATGFAGRVIPALSFRRGLRPALVAIVALGLVATPGRQLVAAARLHSTPTTDVVAAEWIVRNVPPMSRIVRERYTAPLTGPRFMLLTFAQLSEKTVNEYLGAGIDYALASSHNWLRFEREATRYAREVAFYRELAQRGVLVKEFAPTATRGGPIVRIYALSEQARQAAPMLAQR